jgi:hypothetical protein
MIEFVKELRDQLKVSIIRRERNPEDPTDIGSHLLPLTTVILRLDMFPKEEILYNGIIKQESAGTSRIFDNEEVGTLKTRFILGNY